MRGRTDERSRRHLRPAGSWNGGRHTTGSGFAADLEKYNAATLAIWHVLRFIGESVTDGSAVALVEQALRPDEGSRMTDAIKAELRRRNSSRITDERTAT